jgi:hypothetical protein
MIKKLQNKKRMLNAVADKLEKNNDKLAVVPVLPGFVITLRQKINLIDDTHEMQITSSEGYTQLKKDLRNTLTTDLIIVINRAKSYALVNNDQLLISEVNYAAYQLDDLSQENFGTVAGKVLKACTDKFDALKSYGLTDQMLSAVSADLTAYLAAKPGPKVAIVSRKSATTGLNLLFKETDDLLVKIDAMMEIVRETEPGLYADYKSLRLIDDLRGKAKPGKEGETGISGTVGNLETGLNLAGVMVILAGTSYTTSTDADGNYSITLPAAGNYTLNAGLNGFADFTEDNIEVTEGEFADVDFDMEPLK